MKVLIVGDGVAEADAVRERLERAGHVAATCRPHDGGFVCRGAEPDGRCPLDDGVGVALAPFPLDQIEHHGLALGYVCARRAGLPLVALGDHTTPNPDPASTTLVHDLHDIAAVVARAARRPVEPHSAAARRAVRGSLDRHGAKDVDASVWVERFDGRLQIRVTTSDPVESKVGHAAAVRALGAVRDLDPHAAAIGVSVT